MSAPTFAPGISAPVPGAPRRAWFLCSPEGLWVEEESGQARIPELPADARPEVALDGEHFLGRLGDVDCWAASPARGATPPAGLPPRSLRRLFGLLDEQHFAIAGRALQITHWDLTHRFCGRCGEKTTLAAGERARKCPKCELTAYPRVSPAVIVLVRRGREALLARAANFPGAFYSTLAGFVEAGETLEETVHRELREEAGIEVTDLRYFGSQPWPFPHSLMIGFTVQYLSGEAKADGQELVDAQWFAPEALPQVPPKLSISRALIDAWVESELRPAR
jgi:NAD+ diphosphatase